MGASPGNADTLTEEGAGFSVTLATMTTFHWKRNQFLAGARQNSSQPHECRVPKSSGTPHLCGRRVPWKKPVVRPFLALFASGWFLAGFAGSLALSLPTAGRGADSAVAIASFWTHLGLPSPPPYADKAHNAGHETTSGSLPFTAGRRGTPPGPPAARRRNRTRTPPLHLHPG
jgi:hypothetical protein